MHIRRDEIESGHYKFYLFFFFNDTATTEIYTLSLHDALPISFLFDTDIFFRNRAAAFTFQYDGYSKFEIGDRVELTRKLTKRSEEHTSELQSRLHLVCRLLLEKKKKPNQ